MKKLFFLLCLLPLLATYSFAQESRQDVSISAIGTYQPTVNGNGYTQSSTLGKGGLVGYRFMLTPSSAIEGNYQYSRFDMKYKGSGPLSARFDVSFQEVSAAYVHSFVYKKFNPFVEVGGGLLMFHPLDSTGTTLNFGAKTKAFAGLFGGGIAYELSPSWDLRVQYRGLFFKSVDLGVPQFATNRYYVMQQPAIGVAYHF